MQEAYYAHPRLEILPYLPIHVERLLDIGCGAGATTMAVKKHRSVRWAGGVEYVPDIAGRAKAVFDRVWQGDAATAVLEDEIEASSLDLVLCLDVLEHMPDPWTLVRRVSTLVKPGGRLMVSVPNIRNWKFIAKLLFRGDFHYRDAGVLDRTHLRFFVRSTAIELATCGGLRLVAADSAQAWRFPDARWFLSRLSGKRMDEVLAKQWLAISERV